MMTYYRKSPKDGYLQQIVLFRTQFSPIPMIEIPTFSLRIVEFISSPIEVSRYAANCLTLAGKTHAGRAIALGRIG
jgi:hypothetical protein